MYTSIACTLIRFSISGAVYNRPCTCDSNDQAKSTKLKSVNVYIETIKKCPSFQISENLSMPMGQVQGSFDWLSSWEVHFKSKTSLSHHMAYYTFRHTKQILPTDLAGVQYSAVSSQYSAVSMGPWCLLPLLAVMTVATSSSLVRRQVSADFQITPLKSGLNTVRLHWSKTGIC